VLESVLTDVIAFLEMCGTVTANNYHHQENKDKAIVELSSEPKKMLEDQEMEASMASGTVLLEKDKQVEKRSPSGTVPPDRRKELQEIGNETK
jgi:hypothetical protein